MHSPAPPCSPTLNRLTTRSKNAGSCIQLCLPQVPPCWTIHHLNRLDIQPYYSHGSWQHQLASDPSCGSNNQKPTKLAEAQLCSYPGLLMHPALQLKVMIVEGYHCSKSCWDTLFQFMDGHPLSSVECRWHLHCFTGFSTRLDIQSCLV